MNNIDSIVETEIEALGHCAFMGLCSSMAAHHLLDKPVGIKEVGLHVLYWFIGFNFVGLIYGTLKFVFCRKNGLRRL